MWLPSASELNVCVVGLVQSSYGAPSSWQRTLATASLTVNVNVDELWVVGFVGSEVGSIATAMDAGSRSTAVTVPVIVGPPG